MHSLNGAVSARSPTPNVIALVRLRAVPLDYRLSRRCHTLFGSGSPTALGSLALHWRAPARRRPFSDFVDDIDSIAPPQNLAIKPMLGQHGLSLKGEPAS